jgi:hypothetical protein
MGRVRGEPEMNNQNLYVTEFIKSGRYATTISLLREYYPELYNTLGDFSLSITSLTNLFEEVIRRENPDYLDLLGGEELEEDSLDNAAVFAYILLGSRKAKIILSN